jgi:hypothetical protein
MGTYRGAVEELHQVRRLTSFGEQLEERLGHARPAQSLEPLTDAVPAAEPLWQCRLRRCAGAPSNRAPAGGCPTDVMVSGASPLRPRRAQVRRVRTTHAQTGQAHRELDRRLTRGWWLDHPGRSRKSNR